jgi:uroporphyrin-III C-methyltransferase / precorrin-2 dehydrogenase / sirohydrochlorin ferrochelatase
MQALPIFFNIKNRHCVVIGGGDVAMRKVSMLLKAQAAITLYSPEICHELQGLPKRLNLCKVILSLLTLTKACCKAHVW